MLPPDLASMMGSPAPGAEAGGMPPDMMAMLGGGAEEEAPLPGVTDGTPGGGEDPLVAAIDMIQEAIDAESDQEDIQVMLKCQTTLQGILAKNQKDSDSALGGSASPAAMRKMAGSL